VLFDLVLRKLVVFSQIGSEIDMRLRWILNRPNKVHAHSQRKTCTNQNGTYYFYKTLIYKLINFFRSDINFSFDIFDFVLQMIKIEVNLKKN
jgi:hypothetical protein